MVVVVASQGAFAALASAFCFLLRGGHPRGAPAARMPAKI
jgi:hypothetical protein